jgi:predicted amidophosphoribosyltransferase
MPRAGAAPYRAVFAYEGDGRRLLHALKYRNGRALARPLGAAMVALVALYPLDVVTWAPTAANRRRRRGYDQAELLARAVAAHLGRRCRPLLRRSDRAGPQTGRPRAERLARAPTFVARRSLAGNVLLVDDVITTGATLHAAATALLAGGAGRVQAIAAAATPRPRPSLESAVGGAEPVTAAARTLGGPDRKERPWTSP